MKKLKIFLNYDFFAIIAAGKEEIARRKALYFQKNKA
jgi:hypothetical protein